MYQITYYVPELSLQKTKSAMFSAGAGKIGNYDSCSWQIKGEGQFRPLADSSPHIGTKGSINFEEEFKVEMICEDKFLTEAVNALIKAHPYETPAYFVTKNEFNL